jgi:hypothetical protein
MPPKRKTSDSNNTTGNVKNMWKIIVPYPMGTMGSFPGIKAAGA